MAQTAYPISDITATNVTGVPVNTAGDRWQNLDDASDTDYVRHTNSANSCTYECLLGPLTDPLVSTGHIATVRLIRTEVAVVPLTVGLYQGATLVRTIASGVSPSSGGDTYTATLTTGEANGITDYSDLRIRMTSNGSVNSRRGAICWAKMEAPDAPSGLTRRVFLI